MANVTIEDMERVSLFARTERWAGAGGTILRMRAIPENMVGETILIGWGTPSVETKIVGSVANRDVTLTTPLANAHQVNEIVVRTTILGTTILPPYNVKAFGATGDGITDDTASIQATLNAAALVNGAVHIPVGDYIFSSPLNIAAGTAIDAPAPGISGASKLVWNGAPLLSDTVSLATSPTIFRGTVAAGADDAWNGRVLIFTGGALAGEFGQISDYDSVTKEFTLEVALTGAPGIGDTFEICAPLLQPNGALYSTAVDNISISNLEIDGNSQSCIGVDLRSGTNWDTLGLYIHDCTVGVRMFRSGNCFFNSLREPVITGCAIGLYVTGSGGYGATNAANSNRLYGGTFNANGIAIYGEKYNDLLLHSPSIEASTVMALKLAGKSAILFGGRVENNGTPPITVVAGATHTAILYPYVAAVAAGGPIVSDAGTATIILMNDTGSGLGTVLGDYLKMNKLLPKYIQSQSTPLDIDGAPLGTSAANVRTRFNRNVKATSGNMVEFLNSDGGGTVLAAVDYLGNIQTPRVLLTGRGVRFAVLAAAPAGPVAGEVCYADGAGWNPGGTGEGLYCYEAGAWVKL